MNPSRPLRAILSEPVRNPRPRAEVRMSCCRLLASPACWTLLERPKQLRCLEFVQGKTLLFGVQCFRPYPPHPNSRAGSRVLITCLQEHENINIDVARLANRALSTYLFVGGVGVGGGLYRVSDLSFRVFAFGGFRIWGLGLGFGGYAYKREKKHCTYVYVCAHIHTHTHAHVYVCIYICAYTRLL